MDTHVVVWLYIERHDKIPPDTRARISREPVRHSPIVRLELAYLQEIGRLTDSPDQVLGELDSALGLTETTHPFGHVVDKAAHPILGQPWFTRDPFDRLIVATALAEKSLLVTGDARIREHLPDHTIWD
ncbi:type II toxin-antitoxin system VapC family toxin [Nocardioides albidus]|uniref:type II toxin-antitoxin system VapC family toxin n=1 Tax=Nocardioides albidus TaxID=1517589 RepID=UPI001960CDEF|nr:PIN domain-containing protein [Nocardioides albidus]